MNQTDGVSISTHTPAWGVTALHASLSAHTAISTHTPAWGVTRQHCQYCRMDKNFNSHARVGRDPWCSSDRDFVTYFNSHARVGRDGFFLCPFVFFGHFNSHARVGRDILIAKKFVIPFEFQLTRPRGA